MATTHLSGKENEGTKGEGLEGSFALLLDEIILNPEVNKQPLGNKEVWVRDSKGSKPYLKSNTGLLESDK